MSREKRREIPEGIVWLALALLLLLAPLPFVTEENADRILRVLPLVALFAFPLIMLLALLFPRGLRLPLGPVVLRILPPGAYFVSYYSASRWLEDGRSRYLEIADKLDAWRGEHDAMKTRITAGIADASDDDHVADLAVGMFLRSYTNYDGALAAATAAATDELREKLAQPAAATTAGILDQHAAWESATAAALGLIKARMAAWDTFADDTLDQAKGMTIDALTRLERRILTRLEPRSLAGAAQIAAIEAEVAELTQRQPGRKKRGAPQQWTRQQVEELHAAFLRRPISQSHDEFCKAHGVPYRQQMYQLFDREGLEWRSKEIRREFPY